MRLGPTGAVIFTIGHSTRTADEFLMLLRAHEVRLVADVRTVPRSRRHPHFSSDTLAVFLAAHGIRYVHLSGLGGLRKPRRDSANSGWRNDSFRGYADHMSSRQCIDDLDRLIARADAQRTAVMCAEAKWWQCHRQLIADALVARGQEVRHIMSATQAPLHELTRFARVEGSSVSYPGLV